MYSETLEKYSRISEPQKNKLLQLVLEENLAAYRGQEHKEHRKRWWTQVSEILNALPGANKTPQQWEKTHKDLTLKVRKQRLEATQDKSKIKSSDKQPVDRSDFHDQMTYLINKDPYLTEEETSPECKAFIQSKAEALDRIAYSQEAMAMASRQNSDSFEKLVDIVVEFLARK